jgi:uncharacterized protein (TIRG00374 family)
MRKYRNQIFIGLLLALGIYVVYLLVADSQLQLSEGENAQEALARYAWGTLPLLVALQCVVVLFRFITWQYYLGVVGARDKISLFDSAVLQISGFVLVVSPGKAAEALKSVFLKVKTGVSIAQTLPIVMAERIMDGLAVIAILVGTVLLAGNALNLGSYGGVDYDALSRVITFSSLVAIVGGLIVVQIQPLAYAVLRVIGALPLVGARIAPPLTAFYESSREIFHVRHVARMVLVGLGVYLPSALSLLVVLAGFGLEVTWQLALQATFIVGVTSAIGALSLVPNGAGIAEVSTVGMLLAFVAPINPALTPAVAVVASLIQGFFHKWFRVLLGLGVAMLFRHRLFDEPALEREIAAYQG